LAGGKMIRVAISGTGRMGSTVYNAITSAEDMEVVGVVDPIALNFDIPDEITTHNDADQLFELVKPDVVVDFTNTEAIPRLIKAVLNHNVRPVIGTSGLDVDTLSNLKKELSKKRLGGVVASNFAIGAVMLMYFSQLASKYFDTAEIIELHHEKKVDAPSGTALTTAEKMRETRGSDFINNIPDITHIENTRGGLLNGIPIHSIRLPGLVAHQEVIFGSDGQTLSLRHDSTGLDSFMPGVLMSVREVVKQDIFFNGLDSLFGLK
tara:strand:+ start:13656 stop:14447 length:792 start_codon:yes stop_codon:yes gene_type:complete